MKKLLCVCLAALMLAGCAAAPVETGPAEIKEVLIELSDNGVTTEAPGVTVSEEAIGTVVRITEPGTYRVTGGITQGQIAVDLGEGAKNDPAAVVTLILDNAEISCNEAPAILFHNVYECGEPNSPDAGARIVLADGSANAVKGFHTTEFDGAVYSRMSMVIDGTGVLGITAGHEGLCSERHLTINGGVLNIESRDDGINANEDGLSVVTVNGGHIRVDVSGDDGDGIDSNGWLVINGGTVEACAAGENAGLDADLGIAVKGGTVLAAGNMPIRLTEDSRTHALFSFTNFQKGKVYTLKDDYAETVLELQTSRPFRCLLLCGPELTEGTYTLWSGETQFQGHAGAGGGLGTIERPEWPDDRGDEIEIPPQPTQPIVTYGVVGGADASEQPEQMPVPQLPEDGAAMLRPEPPEGGENMPVPDLPDGVEPPAETRRPIGGTILVGRVVTEFTITKGANYFANLTPMA